MAKRKETAKAGEETKLVDKPTGDSRNIRAKPLVFISHDSRDADLAEEFGNLLSDVSGGTLKSFRSSDRKGTAGIEFGAEWYQAIMTKLSDATDVVVLLTQNSINRPWILYEAGVAKGKLDTIVFGIAIGVPLEKIITGPFGQFQNCSDEEDKLTQLVMQLISRIPDASPREEAVRRQVKVFKDNVTKLLKERTKTGANGKIGEAETSVAKLFEEVKIMISQLPDKMEGSFQQVTRYRGSRMIRRFHPMMIEELLHMSGESGDPVSILLAASFIRDDAPWLYELAMEVYRAVRSKDTIAIRREMKRLQRFSDTVMHGPFMEELGVDKDSFFFYREFPRILENLLDRMIVEKKPISQHRTLRKEPDKT
jgi:hypothetical protein